MSVAMGALGGRVMLTRQQHKGVSHVSIASAYDRGHEVGETVSSYSRLCEEKVRAYLRCVSTVPRVGRSRPTRMAEPWGGGAEVPGFPRFRFHSTLGLAPGVQPNSVEPAELLSKLSFGELPRPTMQASPQGRC